MMVKALIECCCGVCLVSHNRNKDIVKVKFCPMCGKRWKGGD